MDCRSPVAQFSFAPPLDCYLHYRILPAEKAVPSLLTQANGTTTWTCLFSLLSEYSYLACLRLVCVYGSAFLLTCQHCQFTRILEQIFSGLHLPYHPSLIHQPSHPTPY